MSDVKINILPINMKILLLPNLFDIESLTLEDNGLIKKVKAEHKNQTKATIAECILNIAIKGVAREYSTPKATFTMTSEQEIAKIRFLDMRAKFDMVKES